MSRARLSWLLLLGILVLQFVMADRFAAVLPWRKAGKAHGHVLGDLGAPDERAHANLIGMMLRGEDVPPLRVGDPGLAENYEVHQAPLYYRLSAVYLRALGYSSVESEGAGRAVRRLNIGFGCLNTIALFCLGSFVFRSRYVGLIGAACLAFLPMWLAVTASVNNDALLCACITAAMAAWLYSLSGERWHMSWGLVGVSLGAAAIWTKTSGILVVPAMGIAAVDYVIHRKAAVNSPTSRGAEFSTRLLPLFACFLVLLLAGPLLAKNKANYGDILGQKTFNQAFKSQARRVSPWRSTLASTTFLWSLTDETEESAFGVFGYMDVHYRGIPDRLAWMVVWPMAGIGMILLLYSRQRNAALSLATLMLLTIAGYIAFNTIYRQPQGRYMFPGIPFLLMGLGEGFRRIWRELAVVGLLMLISVSWQTPDELAPQFRQRMDDLRKSVDVHHDRSGVVAPAVQKGGVDQLPGR